VAGAVMGLTNVAFAVTPPVISVAPTSIDWTSNAWVTLTVSNTLAGDVKLELYLDVQGNGVVDAADPLLAAYRVRDGKTNALGSSVIVDDEDGLTNNVVVSRIAYFGGEGTFHVPGNYLWLARRVSGGTSAAASFSVTQPASSVWITGSVINYVTSNPVPAAEVLLEYFADGTATPPAVWTGTNGAFKIYLPQGISTAAVWSIATVGFGYFNPVNDKTGDALVATYVFTNDLQAGNNPLPIPLRCVPDVPDNVFGVSGHVYDDQTNALPGVMMQVDCDGRENDKVMTDTNGAYHISMIKNNGAFGNPGSSSLHPDPPALMYLGLVVVGKDLIVTNTMTGVDFYCPRATILARGKVLAEGNGVPVVGATVSFDGDQFGGAGVSLADGTYEVGLIAYTNYDAGVDTLGGQGFVEFPGFGGQVITNTGAVFTNLNFALTRGYSLSGNVYGPGTEELTGGSVGYITDFVSWNSEDNADVNRHGYYEFLLPTGTYGIGAGDFDGYISQHLANMFTLTTNGLTGVDIHLDRASFISGHVYRQDNGQPLTNCNVNASDYGSNDSINGADTDTNGYYSLQVPAGTYRVRADPVDHGLFYESKFYYDAVYNNNASQVVVTASNNATGIDFVLRPAGIISGHIYADDGISAVPHCSINIVDYTTGDGKGGGQSDNDGNYRFALLEGSYKVVTYPAYNGLPYLDTWYSNALDQASAVRVDVTLSHQTGGIDFYLIVKDLSYTNWLAHFFTPAERADTNISGDAADPDHDGANNLAEYFADTNPRLSNSVLRVTAHRREGGSSRIEWKGGRWALQYLQRCEKLTSTGEVWIAIFTNDVVPTVSTNFVQDSNSVPPAMYYRIKAVR